MLHTWTRELAFHPHAHCIVTGGGLALDGSRWVSAPGEFLFPVRVLGALFRGKVLDGLARARRDGRLRLAPDDEGRAAARRTDALHRAAWIVYAKRPFGGPEQVYRYLGRYTHRVAISNSRLVSATDETVTFRTRGDQTASLPPLVFLRRFLQHVLPFGFVKIRHYGLLASGNVTTRLERARALLGGGVAERNEQIKQQDSESDESWPELLAAVAAVGITLCPSCGAHALQRGPLCPLTAPPTRRSRAAPGRRVTGAQPRNDAHAVVRLRPGARARCDSRDGLHCRPKAGDLSILGAPATRAHPNSPHGLLLRPSRRAKIPIAPCAAAQRLLPTHLSANARLVGLALPRSTRAGRYSLC